LAFADFGSQLSGDAAITRIRVLLPVGCPSRHPGQSEKRERESIENNKIDSQRTTLHEKPVSEFLVLCTLRTLP